MNQCESKTDPLIKKKGRVFLKKTKQNKENNRGFVILHFYVLVAGAVA